MLREWLEYCTTPCPAVWRDYGFLREQIAIEARLRRQRASWAPHLAAVRAAIVEATQQVATGVHNPERSPSECVLVVGGGLAHDLPLDPLAKAFSRVVLADVVHRPWSAWRSRWRRPGVRCVEFDATGVLRGWREMGRRTKRATEDLVADLQAADPGVPAACQGEPQLVVSANVASQLMLLPSEWWERAGAREDGFRAILERAAVARHLAWLTARPGAVLFVTDFRRRWRDRTGRVIAEEAVPGLEALRAPDRSWTWRVAPIPEYAPDRHLEHEVGVWWWRQGRLLRDES